MTTFETKRTRDTVAINVLPDDSSKKIMSRSINQEGSPPVFCSMDNIQKTVLLLSQEFQSLGLRHKLIEGSGEKLNIVSLINSSWEVVQLYYSSVKDLNSVHDCRRRDVTDLKYLQNSIIELREHLEEKDRQLCEAQEKQRQISSINKTLTAKIKSEKDEVRRLTSFIQQREGHHQHEMRKKENESHKLKDRLQHLVSCDRGSEGKTSQLIMSRSLSQGDRSLGRSKGDGGTIGNEDDLYRRVLSQYEQWALQLSEESNQCKEYLIAVLLELTKMAEKGKELEVDKLVEGCSLTDVNIGCSNLSTDSLEDDQSATVEFTSNIEDIQKKVKERMNVIQELINKVDLNAPSRTSIDLNSSLIADIDMISDDVCIEKWHAFNEHQKKFSLEKAKLTDEKEKFAAAVIRLNREKVQFEREKVELLRQQFLKDFPADICDPRESHTPQNSGGSSFKISLNDLENSESSRISFPNIVSPKGDIKMTLNPVLLGDCRMNLNSSIDQHSCGNVSSRLGKSAPTTRNPSLGRSSEDKLPLSLASNSNDYAIQRPFKSRTLERPSRYAQSAGSQSQRASVSRSSSIGQRARDISKDRSRYSDRRPYDSHKASMNPGILPIMSRSIGSPPRKSDYSRRDFSDILNNSDGETSNHHGINKSYLSPSSRERVQRSLKQGGLPRPVSLEIDLAEGMKTLEDMSNKYSSTPPRAKQYHLENVKNKLPKEDHDGSNLSALETSFLALLDQVNKDKPQKPDYNFNCANRDSIRERECQSFKPGSPEPRKFLLKDLIVSHDTPTRESSLASDHSQMSQIASQQLRDSIRMRERLETHNRANSEPTHRLSSPKPKNLPFKYQIPTKLPSISGATPDVIVDRSSVNFVPSPFSLASSPRLYSKRNKTTDLSGHD